MSDQIGAALIALPARVLAQWLRGREARPYTARIAYEQTMALTPESTAGSVEAEKTVEVLLNAANEAPG